jgi:hypothetical protein
MKRSMRKSKKDRARKNRVKKHSKTARKNRKVLKGGFLDKVGKAVGDTASDVGNAAYSGLTVVGNAFGITPSNRQQPVQVQQSIPVQVQQPLQQQPQPLPAQQPALVQGQEQLQVSPNIDYALLEDLITIGKRIKINGIGYSTSSFTDKQILLNTAISKLNDDEKIMFLKDLPKGRYRTLKPQADALLTNIDKYKSRYQK